MYRPSVAPPVPNTGQFSGHLLAAKDFQDRALAEASLARQLAAAPVPAGPARAGRWQRGLVTLLHALMRAASWPALWLPGSHPRSSIGLSLPAPTPPVDDPILRSEEVARTTA